MVQFNPVSILLLVCFLFNIGFAFYLIRRKQVPGTKYLALLFIALAIWSGAYGTELFFTTPREMFWFTRLAYIGVVPTPLLILFFSSTYTGKIRWMSSSLLPLIYIIPAFTLLFTFLFPWIKLFFIPDKPVLVKGNIYQLLQKGPWWYIHVLYSYGLTIIGYFQLVQMSFRVTSINRKNMMIILLGAFLPFIINVLMLSGIFLIRQIDVTPVAFTLTAILFFIGINRNILFQDVPVSVNVLYNVIPDGIITVGSAGTIIDFNPAARDIIGINSTFLKGRKISDIITHSDFLNSTMETYQCEIEYRGKWLEIIHSPLKLEPSNFYGSLLVIRDITVKKNAEETIQKQNEQLQDLNAQKDKYFSIIAHDLRNPFSALLSFCQMMEKKYDQQTDKQRKEYIALLFKASKRGFDLLENLLDWSRSQLGLIPFCPEPLDMNNLITSVLSEAELMARSKNINLQFTPLINLPMILGEENMLRTVCRNLLTNALKYTPEQGLVNISTRIEDHQAEFTFTDTGNGMDQHVLNHLFRLDKVRSLPGTKGEKGTGLGLILCKEFIEKHGGHFFVESKPGQGTSVRFSLPTI